MTQVKIFRVLLTALKNYIPIYQQILSISSCKINPGFLCFLPPPLDQAIIFSHLNYCCCLSIGFLDFTFISGAPNLQDLMPDDLQWSWYNNNRNKVNNKCNVIESSQNHPPTPSPWGKMSSMKPVPGAKNVGDCWEGSPGDWLVRRLR